jgi:Holliday junction resolvase RusA-like endonuclease
MTFMVCFDIEGNPVPKGRPRFRRTKTFITTYTPKKTLDFEELVRKHSKEAMGPTDRLETPISVYLYFRLPIPQSYSKKRKEACLSGFDKPISMRQGDIDNLAKVVLDGMNGVIYKDDSQITCLHCTKVYSNVPGVNILIKEDLD